MDQLPRQEAMRAKRAAHALEGLDPQAFVQPKPNSKQIVALYWKQTQRAKKSWKCQKKWPTN